MRADAVAALYTAAPGESTEESGRPAANRTRARAIPTCAVRRLWRA
jgi:hypothetical protein